ncbi:hypothetical protein TSOC_007054 [Tetrabaena socialis]|uniref:Uncharacterized protein n=1 Tax=Tetrabaena socialis TaxID=47790 RepID=A0A2J8A252_9CHLO|nr:hypothetical protein TSOC_007054 [Tetrabaena socialis]|eukprot:PNH06590.1 hypothetical protein TSOC_007054 [Tetrabaena socialis]
MTQPLPSRQLVPPPQQDTGPAPPCTEVEIVDGTGGLPLAAPAPVLPRMRPVFAPPPSDRQHSTPAHRQPLAPVIPTHAAEKARAVAVMARRLALAEPLPQPQRAPLMTGPGTAATAPGGVLPPHRAASAPGSPAAFTGMRVASTAAAPERVAGLRAPLGWELSVSCYGARSRHAERLMSWMPVCVLPGDGSMGTAVLTAEQLLLSLVTEAEPYWYSGAFAPPANPASTSRSSGGDGDAVALPTELAAAVAAAARNATDVPITASSLQAGLQRVSLDRVGAREPSAAQQGLLMRLMRQGHMRSVDPEVFYALCPEALQASLAAAAENGGGGQSSTAATDLPPPLDAAADAPQLGLLLHHVLAVQQLEVAAENALEAKSAEAAAALGLPPPITRRQRGTVQSLMRRAARGVEADSGSWLRSIFRGAVPERRLQRLVSELVGDEYFGSASDSYELEMYLRRQAGQKSRGPPVPPMDALLGMLSREGAAEVIKRLQGQVNKLPPRED